ncbi:hypothetical protein TrVFT333_003147 [Trichoderma virens FT-333]|nr:hypothetical protein TrVFT333_003147 [Trichoderma virens FT-333]
MDHFIPFPYMGTKRKATTSMAVQEKKLKTSCAAPVAAAPEVHDENEDDDNGDDDDDDDDEDEFEYEEDSSDTEHRAQRSDNRPLCSRQTCTHDSNRARLESIQIRSLREKIAQLQNELYAEKKGRLDLLVIVEGLQKEIRRLAIERVNDKKEVMRSIELNNAAITELKDNFEAVEEDIEVIKEDVDLNKVAIDVNKTSLEKVEVHNSSLEHRLRRQETDLSTFFELRKGIFEDDGNFFDGDGNVLDDDGIVLNDDGIVLNDDGIVLEG